MKTLQVLLTLFIVGFSSFNLVISRTLSTEDDLFLANVEALANEEGIGSGNYDVSEQYSDYYMNGVLYKQSKVVKCYEGGSYACMEGNYYRYKNDNGEWSAWTPA